MPSKTELIIAKKFLGNADESQEEMVHFAVEGARKWFVRSSIGSEEAVFSRARGFEPILVSGISSALVGPTFGGIPLTHHGVASSMVVWGGVGAGYRCQSIRWLF
ncbi:uncharacterized protein LACBIDRAFT_303005 [Laccaria bicolor S238N-H82]|uniref:Predicted protein n=1 Tax=Laccaria bicolor (strain S238N-H82 / ATCC MYA-4686) TaxID=486041 RepID=B0DNI6_LACBS|nr:uncharacterized protein LACBIDRAFT_306666 [Laccaria bicolor S238N-H82]XP_001885514.1 uncharacterized protein LACBIDRAFT_306667 [Laccaria bicolor S238N-H82]XP_001890975.1 uncharacterized protein LACBIDRAFT_303005 [Laccaria bicolor S238N-H82]EDQ98374.1 predicted protein [Laccaria bicolor S238N-H82]EDR03945.1 predicted protein [Laccaria bicolor S238N-H82]EDR03946.1 predicted protein [Laccaria bicolor S238N-H82]|eukprot:XP_001885513.1 predicted protein [Laccaria bicolor S238N-H82]